VLDEASSALDSALEQDVVSSLNRLRAGRTTLIIAHRYAAIQSAHFVVYLNDNGSVSIGKHKQLMKEHMGYQQAVRWQVNQVSQVENLITVCLMMYVVFYL